MKVILLKDVAKIGRRYEEVTVPSGYALNMLIPQGAAQTATKENIKRVGALKSRQAADTSASDEALTIALEALAATPLVIKAEANEQDHLFEAIKAEMIAESAKAAGYYIAAGALSITEPIKALGEFKIPVSQGDITGELTISVEKA